MAHIYLGWEFGANRGHATLLAAIATTLRARGHRISFALQRVDALHRSIVADAPVWAAPVTPRLLVNPRRSSRPAYSLGDILARLGCDDPDLLAALLRAWRTLLRASRPDLVVGNYAPFLLTAARGLCPTVSVGTWFSVPPSSMEDFPSLDGREPSFDEGRLVERVNFAVRGLGSQPLDRLPALFAASREIAGSIVELDRYQNWRTAPLAMPMLAGGEPPLARGRGHELFVYAPELIGIDSPLWAGLARTSLAVRVHAACGENDALCGSERASCVGGDWIKPVGSRVPVRHAPAHAALRTASSIIPFRGKTSAAIMKSPTDYMVI